MQDYYAQAPLPEAAPAPAPRRRVGDILIGVLVMLLACYGAFRLVWAGVKLLQNKKAEASAATIINFFIRALFR